MLYPWTEFKASLIHTTLSYNRNVEKTLNHLRTQRRERKLFCVVYRVISLTSQGRLLRYRLLNNPDQFVSPVMNTTELKISHFD